MKKVILGIFFSLVLSLSVSADTIHLKNGKTVEGEIKEENENYVVIKAYGIDLTYYNDQIDSVEKASPKEEIQNYKQEEPEILEQETGEQEPLNLPEEEITFPDQEEMVLPEEVQKDVPIKPRETLQEGQYYSKDFQFKMVVPSGWTVLDAYTNVEYFKQAQSDLAGQDPSLLACVLVKGQITGLGIPGISLIVQPVPEQRQGSSLTEIFQAMKDQGNEVELLSLGDRQWIRWHVFTKPMSELGVNEEQFKDRVVSQITYLTVEKDKEVFFGYIDFQEDVATNQSVCEDVVKTFSW